MDNLFIYGTLCHLPLLAKVIGRLPEMAKAHLPGHAVFRAADHDFPVITESPGGQANGWLLSGLSADDYARLNYYEGPFGFRCLEKEIETAWGETVPAQVYIPDAGLWQPGAPWDLADWQAEWGEIVEATAGDVMALYPQPLARSRRLPMLVRGASRLRAAAPVQDTLRRPVAPDDVRISAKTTPYANFFAVEEYDLTHRRFDGSEGAPINRAVFVSGDAVTVLPYDPKRDRVLVVEQFRAGPMARGDAQPWQLEPVAGRIDPGETPEQAAIREASEEAGLTLTKLLPVAGYYPSPGAKTEFLYSYIALTDLPDDAGIVSGIESEGEDIKGHVISFDRLMALVASGEAATSPLIISALWLQRERPGLRAQDA